MVGTLSTDSSESEPMSLSLSLSEPPDISVEWAKKEKKKVVNYWSIVLETLDTIHPTFVCRASNSIKIYSSCSLTPFAPVGLFVPSFSSRCTLSILQFP